MSYSAPPVLAEVERSGFVESVHRGSVVVLTADGKVRHAIGDVVAPMYPRSSIKPVQAAAMVRSGAPLSGELLALVCASHAGEDFHVDGVRKMLALAGVDETALQCPPDLPLDIGARLRFVREGDQTDRRLTMNCSGKHAGMLLACMNNRWPLETYLEPTHPLQRRIRSEIEMASGEPVAHTGVDGCGAPVEAISLTGLARAVRRIALAWPDTPEHEVALAIRTHPDHVAGTQQPDTWVMSDIPGSIAKIGAEGVQVVALPDGQTAALKIEDGDAGHRVARAILVELLRALGVDAPVLERLSANDIMGGGRPVGTITTRPIH